MRLHVSVSLLHFRELKFFLYFHCFSFTTFAGVMLLNFTTYAVTTCGRLVYYICGYYTCGRFLLHLREITILAGVFYYTYGRFLLHLRRLLPPPHKTNLYLRDFGHFDLPIRYPPRECDFKTLFLRTPEV